MNYRTVLFKQITLQYHFSGNIALQQIGCQLCQLGTLPFSQRNMPA